MLRFIRYTFCSSPPPNPALSLPGHVARSVDNLTEEPEVPGSIPGPAPTFLETDHNIFSTVILSLPVILAGQLSVNGESLVTLYWLNKE